MSSCFHFLFCGNCLQVTPRLAFSLGHGGKSKNKCTEKKVNLLKEARGYLIAQVGEGWAGGGRTEAGAKLFSGALGICSLNWGLSLAFLSAIHLVDSFWESPTCPVLGTGEVRSHHQASGEETKVAPRFLRRGVGKSRRRTPNPVRGHLQASWRKCLENGIVKNQKGAPRQKGRALLAVGGEHGGMYA